MPATKARISSPPLNNDGSIGTMIPGPTSPASQAPVQTDLTAEEIALPNEELIEVERRLVGFREEFKPTGEVGETLVRRAAILSIRLDRCVSYETARLSERIRRAEADFVAPQGLSPEDLTRLKAESRALAMFDPSNEAALARKFEVATERSFFRALKEIRQVESQARMASHPPETEDFSETLASFFQRQREGDELEARYLEPDERTASILAKRNPASHFSPPGGPVDIPFTIGRHR